MDVEADQEEESKILAEDDTGEEDDTDEGEKESSMERYCGVGRVWIFLALGVLTLVLSAVLAGVHMNVRVVTSSLDQVEVVPFFLPAATAGVAGVMSLLLFWKRFKALVYVAVTTCVAAAVLCVVAAVLTGTHVLRPLLSVSGCVYHQLEKACRCVTQFRRMGIGLEEASTGEHVFLTMEGTLGCDDVYTVIPGLMYAMVGVYGVITVVCLVEAVIALLVYRTETRRKYLQNLAYDDQFLRPGGQPDIYTEHHTMLPLHSSSASSDPKILNTYINSGNTTHDEDTSTTNDGNTTPSDLIYSPADVPMGYTEACRMRRCQSFSQPRRGSEREGSPASSASSQAASLTGGDNNFGRPAGGSTKLKAHRRKGRRAVTLHGLDREQLLLILSLQMRYLQESSQAEGQHNPSNGGNTSKQSGPMDSADSCLLFAQRRALTPTPRQERLSSNRSTDDDLDYRPAKLVRSHTPQPYHFRTPNEYSRNQYRRNQSQQPPPQPGNDEQPTLITFDLRNIKAVPVVHGHNSSARSSVSGCGPDSSPSSHNSSLTCSGVGQNQFQLTSASCNPHLLVEPEDQSSRHVSSHQHTSTSSQSDCDNSPSDTKKLISSEENLTPEPAKNMPRTSQEQAKNMPRKAPKNEKIKMKLLVNPVGVAARPAGLCRADSNSSKVCLGADRWQTLTEDGTSQVQTLWENIQRRPPSDPHDATVDPPGAAVNPILFPRHEATAPDTEHCEAPHSINLQLKDASSAAMRSECPQSDQSPQATLIGQLDSLNVVFNNLPETRIVPAHFAIPSNICYQPHQNAFIPIDSSSTDTSEDADQTDCPSGFTNMDMQSEVPLPPRRDDRQMAKRDHCRSGVQSRSDRAPSRSTDEFGRDMASAAHFSDPHSRPNDDPHRPTNDPHSRPTNDPHRPTIDPHRPTNDPHSRPTNDPHKPTIDPHRPTNDPHKPTIDPHRPTIDQHRPTNNPHSRPSTTVGQFVDPELFTMTDQEIEGSFRGSDRMDGSFRGSDRIEGSFRGSDRIDGSFRGSDRIEGSFRGSDRMDGSLRGSDRMDGSLRGSDRMDGSFRGSDRIDGSFRGSDRIDGSFRGSDRIEGSFRGSGRIDGSFRASDRLDRSFRGSDRIDGSFSGGDRMEESFGGTDRRYIDDRRRIIDKHLEDNARPVVDRYIENDRRRTSERYQEDDRRRMSDRSLDSDIQYETTNDMYGQSRRQTGRATRLMSDQQADHKPYTAQTNRHAYNSSGHRPQHSAFYTLAHGPRIGSISHHHHEAACDTDLDSLPAPQYVRGQSLPPPSLHHSLESVARAGHSRPGFTTPSESQGALVTERPVNASRRGHLDSRSGGHIWNPNTSRYPVYQSGFSTDHRFHNKQQWHPQVSRGLSREQLYTDSHAHVSRGLSREQLYTDSHAHANNRRQPHVNIRRCQSVDEGNTQAHPSSYRAAHKGSSGAFYQNQNALRAELKAGQPGGAHSRHPVFQSYPTSEGNVRAMTSKNFPTNDIAGYVGVAKLVQSSDSDEFVETVI